MLPNVFVGKRSLTTGTPSFILSSLRKLFSANAGIGGVGDSASYIQLRVDVMINSKIII